MTTSRAPSRTITLKPAAQVRRRLLIRGVVQGVGFRPGVYRLATERGLHGWVRNTPQGVEIEIQGDSQGVDGFEYRLQQDPPPHWAIQSIESTRLGLQAQAGFAIRDSLHRDEHPRCSIPPDLATCDLCLGEVFDPRDRRFGYPFTNCTACGPRYSIITALPYDRLQTTMQAFDMCPACIAEYDDPDSRRFHAQPNACPACGPQLALLTATGQVLARRSAALDAACTAIRDGKIVAVKGLGGYHLMADARQQETVARLRQRKHRPDKPFALMAPTIASIETICNLSSHEREALLSHRAPIVLLCRRKQHHGIAPAVAPRNPYLGMMLPATPLHHLMMASLGFPVVATSGNLSDEPICIDETEVMQRLASVAELVLAHNRPITRAVDDSIVQEMDGAMRVIRQARGYAPQRITLPARQTSGPLLAVGAHQKSAVALAVESEAILSQHVGDLESPETIDAYRSCIADLKQLLCAAPTSVAVDLHPDYQSTHDAEQLGLPLIKVQHHAAHIYAAMAEHGIGPETSVLGAAWDGTGLGEDGTIWGGELLKVRGASVERIGHLEHFMLPGGNAAARQPWRSALGVLYAVLGSDLFAMQGLPVVTAIPKAERSILHQMLEQGVQSPTTTSAGRMFDAVAALLGLEQQCSFEGQAAMALQFAAESIDSEVKPLRFEISTANPMRLDWRPAIRDILDRLNHDEPKACIARAFHHAMAQGLAQQIHALAKSTQPTVVLTGGCFQNKLLTELTADALRRRGIEPVLHRNVPSNDGGIALGQLYAGVLHETARTEGND